MKAAHSLLPAGFETLEPFAESWGDATAADREHCRLVSNETERVAFYNAAKDQMAAALAFLDQRPLDALDEKERKLMNLMLSLVHVALAVELQSDVEAKHGEFRRHLKITRATADGNI